MSARHSRYRRSFAEDRVYLLRLLALPAAVRVPALVAVERLWTDYQDYLARPDCALGVDICGEGSDPRGDGASRA